MSKNDPIIATFIQEVRVSLNPNNAAKARTALNQVWVGQPNCWKVVPGSEQMVPVIDDPKAYEGLSKAHHIMNMTHPAFIKIHLHKSGAKSIEVA